MKTSLILSNRIFQEAKKEAQKTGQSISQIINSWADLGREIWATQKKKSTKKFKPVSLGEEKTDITNRRDWMDSLDDRS